METKITIDRSLNFTAGTFVPKIPISKRTFSEVKRRHGQEILIDVFELLTSDLELGLKKRQLYDGFEILSEEIKDVFWEAFIEKRLGVSEDWD